MPRPNLPAITSLKLLDLPNGPYPAADLPTGSDSWYRVAVSYKEGGDALCEAVGQDDSLRNFLALPALFLYRHSIELHLKSLLQDAGELLDQPTLVPPQHYILSLWERVRGLLLQVDSRSDGPWLKRAGDIITDFDSLDPTSFAFRYPVDTKGDPSLPTGLRVDLAVVMGIMAELSILLEGASTQISVYMDYKAEMERDG